MNPLACALTLLACLAIRSASASTYAALSEPSRIVIQIQHVDKGGFTCVVNKVGEPCRDLRHWQIVVDKTTTELSHLDDARAAVAALPSSAPGSPEKKANSEIAVLICIDRLAPFIATKAIEDQCARSGILRVSRKVGSNRPSRIAEVRVEVTFDSHMKLTRFVDGREAADEPAVVDLIRKSVMTARSTSEDAAVVVTVAADSPAPWEPVSRLIALCQVEGVCGVESVVRH